MLKEQIELGTWQPGESLPSETELCARFLVSRTVVRQALSVLEQDGHIKRSQGRRTTVLPPKIEPRAGGISRLLAAPNPDVEVIVLSTSTQRPLKRIAEQFNLSPDDSVLRLMSLVLFRGEPLALFDSSFPERAARPLLRVLPPELPAPIPHTRTLRATLGGSRVSIETSFCSKWEAEQLQIPYRGAVFVTFATENQVLSGREVPFEVTRGVYRADRVQFRLELAAGAAFAEARWHMVTR